MRYAEFNEGRVYRIDWGYPRPVMIISNPSRPQARTLIETIRKTSNDIFIRGLIHDEKVYVWDGWSMTHDDVMGQLFPDSPSDTFEIANFTQTSVLDKTYHEAQCHNLQINSDDPKASPFVKNVMQAIDETSK
jgi:hypothetical protein